MQQSIYIQNFFNTIFSVHGIYVEKEEDWS